MDKYSSMLKNDLRFRDRNERLNSFLKQKGHYKVAVDNDLPDTVGNARWLDNNAEELTEEQHNAIVGIHNDPKLPEPYVYTESTEEA